MTLPNNTVKFALTEVDYKPFISLFNVTDATLTNPEISGIGEGTIPHSPAFTHTVVQQLTTPLRSLSNYPRILQANM